MIALLLLLLGVCDLFDVDGVAVVSPRFDLDFLLLRVLGAGEGGVSSLSTSFVAIEYNAENSILGARLADEGVAKAPTERLGRECMKDWDPF